MASTLREISWPGLQYARGKFFTVWLTPLEISFAHAPEIRLPLTFHSLFSAKFGHQSHWGLGPQWIA